MEREGQDPTTNLMDSPPRVVLGAVDLHIVKGPDRGASVRLGPNKIRVGTAAGCDVRLGDATVSRLHCEIHLQRTGIRVTDLDSTNGTFVEGVRVFDAELPSGGLVSIGETVLRLVPANEP